MAVNRYGRSCAGRLARPWLGALRPHPRRQLAGRRAGGAADHRREQGRRLDPQPRAARADGGLVMPDAIILHLAAKARVDVVRCEDAAIALMPTDGQAGPAGPPMSCGHTSSWPAGASGQTRAQARRHGAPALLRRQQRLTARADPPTPNRGDTGHARAPAAPPAYRHRPPGHESAAAAIWREHAEGSAPRCPTTRGHVGRARGREGEGPPVIGLVGHIDEIAWWSPTSAKGLAALRDAAAGTRRCWSASAWCSGRARFRCAA